MSGMKATKKATKKLSTDTNRLLTPLMIEALVKAASPEGLGSWDYASGILGALKAAGLVRQTPRDTTQPRRYAATHDGLRRLAELHSVLAEESRRRLSFPPF